MARRADQEGMGLARFCIALVGASTLALTVSACSDDARPTENLLGADDWAERFCASFTKVEDDLAGLSEAGDLSFVTAQAVTPDDARGVQRRVRLHGPDLVRVLDQLAVNLRDTGAPDVDGGRAFYNEVVQTVGTLQSAVRTAVVTVSDLDLAEAEAPELVVLNETLAGLPSVVEAYQAALTSKAVPDIQVAYADAPSCQGVITSPAP